MPCGLFQLYHRRGGAVETSASPGTDAWADTDAWAAETAVAAGAAGADATATGAATPGAEVATEAFPAGTGAPWHDLPRHVPG
jgi:hypothetical protein